MHRIYDGNPSRMLSILARDSGISANELPEWLKKEPAIPSVALPQEKTETENFIGSGRHDFIAQK